LLWRGADTVGGMRLVIARCRVDYEGRLAAHLPEAVRLLMVKADGCVAVHADGGAYKPLNWMNAPNVLREQPGRWEITNPKGERLTIELLDVLSDTTWEMGADPGLQKDGVEAHLQELLAAAPHVLGDGLTLVRREYPTALGPVDLLCRDAAGLTVAIEVKRRGELDGVEQLSRYVERLTLDSSLGTIRGMFVAQVVKPQARLLAEARGFTVIEVDYDELRGLKVDDLKLF
jgi:RecB family endonuclease NucS